MNRKERQSGRSTKDQAVKYRVEKPLIVEFDRYAAQEGKTRSQMLRELMCERLQQRNSA